MLKSDNHIFAGLQQDLTVSKQQTEYLIDAHNIRITARDGETFLSITNEKGPKEITLKTGNTEVSILGTIIGHCVLNSYLVLFTHDASDEDNVKDHIYRILVSEDSAEVYEMYKNDSSPSLGFDVEHPIEAIADYENESIQKVYWTDGKNQPRMLNLVHATYEWSGSFDFTPELALSETITVEKNTSAAGQFAAGVIQYAFSYYNKYGQETNIFYVSPLYYISFFDRGASAETIVSNTFSIKITNPDTHFDYVRIYSIHRTSLNGTPICKRIQDISLSDNIVADNNITYVSYVDTGDDGDNVDPASLLYVGGEQITAGSMCAKDGTMFLGDIHIERQAASEVKVTDSTTVASAVKNNADIKPSTDVQTQEITRVNSEGYSYSCGLNTQAAGFKKHEYYRLGFQAQYKNGKWSEPIFIKDYQVSFETDDNNKTFPLYEPTDSTIRKPVITVYVPAKVCQALYNSGYKRIRPVVVFPEIQDRTILCQGVVNPTLYTTTHRKDDKDLYAQSSWFFRPNLYQVSSLATYKTNSKFYGLQCSPYSVGEDTILYKGRGLGVDSGTPAAEDVPDYIRGVEIQGYFNEPNRFKTDWKMLTFHSPELELDSSLDNLDFNGVTVKKVGLVGFTANFSDIDIQTSTPTISSEGSGFIHKAWCNKFSSGIISGLFYDDYIVDDSDSNNSAEFRAYTKENASVKWLVYAWNKTGALNNDITRPANKGTQSSTLYKKVISNLRYAETTWFAKDTDISLQSDSKPQLFHSNEVSILKFNNNIYEGNIDTLLAPDDYDGQYFAFDGSAIEDESATALFESTSWWKTWSKKATKSSSQGCYKWETTKWSRKGDDDDKDNIGDGYVGLVTKKSPVRMRYKSSPHIVLSCTSSASIEGCATADYMSALPIFELRRDYDINTTFGGQTSDALKANKWIPAGEPAAITANSGDTRILYQYGDTWYSRFDCLKTYAFSTEDTNQIVEIGSFMLETRLNIDGRYDRNRGQLSNLNMSPTNFNLFNPVYSQKNNFFTYQILDSDYYRLNDFPNQITWSLEKQPAADVDEWTSITLASTYSLDGSKGKIQSLNVWNDGIYCFQDNGISSILFNSRVQIPTSDGVPIEITNNYKVDGKRYISDGMGALNKFAICSTPSALYFLDSVSGHLQAISGEGLADIAQQRNMSVWFKNQDTSLWMPENYTARLFYDRNHRDLYTVTENEALCYSEPLSQFTSFMSYSEIPVMFNVIDDFYCVKNNYLNHMFAGEYNYFFNSFEGYDITFVSNGRTSQEDLFNIDKIFTNIEFRADRWSDKLDGVLSSESPFDYVRVWDEYQDTGEVLLKNTFDRPSVLKKKFRIWRVNIPRDANNRRDRIRNTWCKIKFGTAPRYNDGNNGFMQLHDMKTLFYI